jgi:hypothetical protein
MEFKLVVTDPSAFSDHFGLIKNNLIPFADKNKLPFWITNYKSREEDVILYRISGDKAQLESVEDFLNNLKARGLIVVWASKLWEPKEDAHGRISGLRTKLVDFDPDTQRIDFGYDDQNQLILQFPRDDNVEERMRQLTALFLALGDCTKAVYQRLESKPQDKWIVSLFIHLLLNSMDYSGPDPPSDEHKIRMTPPW